MVSGVTSTKNSYYGDNSLKYYGDKERNDYNLIVFSGMEDDKIKTDLLNLKHLKDFISCKENNEGNGLENLSSMNETELPVFPIKDLTDETKKALLEYIKTNNMSLSEIKNLLKTDSDWREIEKIVSKHFMEEREDDEDFCVNMWTEMKKSEKDREKTLSKFFDEMRKTDAEIMANRIKTNQDINEIYYKALFG